MSRAKVVTRKIGIRALIFLAYLFLGAGVFLGIEQNARKERNLRNTKKFNDSKNMLKIRYGINDTDMNKFVQVLREIGKDGYFKDDHTNNWDFVNAFFFSGNVVTTIGE